MIILAIDTSCDETAVAITDGKKVLANSIYSQILLHKEWGGVVPSIAKRAHKERIDLVVQETLIKLYRYINLLESELASHKNRTVRSSFDLGIRGLSQNSLAQTSTFYANLYNSIFNSIDCIAVTYGPGLAVALEVGIAKAKELATKYNKPLIAVNHMEGHLYSPFIQNSKGNPDIQYKFPYLALLVSGGHTEIVLWEDHLKYTILGKTTDDAAGEALDKAAKMLGLGYPGGAAIEELARQVNNSDIYKFPRPLSKADTLNFSFSGLKTAFYYHLKKNPEETVGKLKELSSSFQKAVFDSLLIKLDLAIKKTGVSHVVVGGGVAANMYLRKKLRGLVRKRNGSVLFPYYKYLNGDNAAMIGVAAYYYAKKNDFVKEINTLDRAPRLSL